MNAFERGEVYHADTIADILSDLPSCHNCIECVSAERVGEWQSRLVHYTDGSHGYRLKCSICENEWISKTTYCPNCGARMENKK